MTHGFVYLQYVINSIREKRDEYKSFVLNGNLKDYAEYRHTCGILRGLDTAEEIVIDLAKRSENADDDGN